MRAEPRSSSRDSINSERIQPNFVDWVVNVPIAFCLIPPNKQEPTISTPKIKSIGPALKHRFMGRNQLIPKFPFS